MHNNTLLLYIIAALAIAYALGNAYGLFVKRARTSITEGSVYSIWTPQSKMIRFRNSKWAKIAYKVGKKQYISYNRIQIPMSAQIGTKITVRYDTLHPDMLYSFSWTKIGVAGVIAVTCLIIAGLGLV